MRQYRYGKTAGRRGAAPKANRRSITDQLRAALHTLRMDVDTEADLDSARQIGLGPHTRRALESGGAPL